MIRGLIPYEFSGTVDQSPAPDRVRCRLEIPAKWSRKKQGNAMRLMEVTNSAHRRDQPCFHLDFGARARRGVRRGGESLLLLTECNSVGPPLAMPGTGGTADTDWGGTATPKLPRLTRPSLLA